MKLNKLVLILGIVAGLVAAVINAFVYEAMAGVWAKPLLIALMLVIFAVIVCTTLLVTMLVTEESEEAFLFLEGKGALIAGLAVVLVVVFGLGMLLEFIYDRDVAVLSAAPTGYVFVLDESGSMGTNDRNNERHVAVNQLMQNMSADFPYAVYMFASRTAQVREMAPLSQGGFQADLNVARNLGGGTDIKDALQTVLDDVRSGKLSNYGNNLRVILLTDGKDSSMNSLTVNNFASNYKTEGISISTVGLGNKASVDSNMLTSLASKTGGVYVHIENAQNLAQGFSSAVQVDVSRDLFSVRNLVTQDWLYVLLRILFLTLLGAAVAFGKALACAREDDTLKIILVGAVAALIGAIVVEVLTALSLPAYIGAAIYWVLLSITPVTKIVRTGDYINIPIYQ